MKLAQRVVAAVVAALCAVLLTAWATRTTEPPLESSGPMVRTATSPTTAAPALPSSAGPSAAAIATARPVAIGSIPTTVSVPALGVHISVRSVGVDRNGNMAIPANEDLAGWYQYGARPGAGQGAAVIAAHVETLDGAGPFSQLRDARAGQTVVVQTAAGPIHYSISDVERIAKDRLDLDAVFDRDGSPVLHLLTCGGPFDRATGHYEDNIVVTARPVS